MQIEDLVFLGLKASVVGLDKNRGVTLWCTQLKGGMSTGGRFVTLLLDGERLFAHTKGEMFCLDAFTGRVLWHNDLPGMGYDVASIAVAGAAVAPAIVRMKRIDEEARSRAAQTT